MPLLTENNALFAQSNALWKSYLESQTSLDAINASRRFNQDFWTNYETLVQKSKAVKVPQRIVKQKQSQGVPPISTVFFKYWSKPFNLQEHLSTHSSVEATNDPHNYTKQAIFYGCMLVLFIIAIPISLFVNTFAGISLMAVATIASLAFAGNMAEANATDTPNTSIFQVDEKVITNQYVSFGTERLQYQFYDYRQSKNIQIQIAYTAIRAIWVDERGLIVVGPNQKALWQDTRTNATYEVILPNEKLLRSFLSDVAMFNFTQKP